MNRLGLILATTVVIGAAMAAILVALGLDPARALMVVGAIAIVAYLVDEFVKMRR